MIGFVAATVSTEERGTVNISLLVDSNGEFQVNLTVELQYIPSELAGEFIDIQYPCHLEIGCKH